MNRLFAWLLNLAYLSAILLALPWLGWSALKYGKYREGFAAKLLGRVPLRRGGLPCVWLHAVSVGEVNLLGPLLDALRASRPNWEFVISTTTKTGFDLARKEYPGQTVFYCPLDFSWATRRAMQRVRPSLLVLAELELWPNLIQAARSRGARVAIVNGRLSDTSLRNYRRLRPLVARVLREVDVVAAQNAETAHRFRLLGADPRAVHVTGSLKFDRAQTIRNNEKTRTLRTLAGLAEGDIVFLAGSTQNPEEECAICTFQELVQDHPQLKLVLVPRHPQRFNEVASLLDQSGLPWIRRTELNALHRPLSSPKSVILVDSVGELGDWWGAATAGFVGGSFGSRGGQNMLEPAAYGVATCFGPNTRNFRDIVSQLLAARGAEVVTDQQSLSRFVRRVLEDPTWAEALGQRAHDLVVSQQGATERTVDLLLRPLGAIDSIPAPSAA
ncbi:MAG: 3-deoxy-D-manno-octulosonic acid transferase [Pirellulales bacterium]|nr:3-deoxy-D-manno-octulosonic acid transferase [Pirellulales bacterium]